MNRLTPEELHDLKEAKSLLENPGFAIKTANHIGKPIEYAIEKIDSKKLNNVTSAALRKSLDLAIGTMGSGEIKAPSNLTHKAMVAASGAVGGAFGLAALSIELPISTTLMLRSIADIAKSQQHDLNDRETQLACLEVFSLGSTTNREDDASESAYFAARGGLAYEMKLALDSVANMSNKAIQEALAKGQMPMLIKLINTISARFGITVSEKAASQALPIIGAAGGATINLVFMNHYQDMAQGHFIVKRLQKKYGDDAIKQLYVSL